MRILVDTQCWLWMNATPERFSRGVLRQVQNTDAVLYLSSASAWEIAIKYALGKLTLPEPPSRYVPDRLRLTRTSPLPVSIEHALRVADLPAHHRLHTLQIEHRHSSAVRMPSSSSGFAWARRLAPARARPERR